MGSSKNSFDKENKNVFSRDNCISYVMINTYEFCVLSVVVTLSFFIFLIFSASSRYIINLVI